MNLRLISNPRAVLACVVAALTSALAASATGQTMHAPAAAMVTPAAPAPAEFRSTLEDYRPYTEEKIISWKDANDTTGGVGGWRAYAKEAQQAASPEAASQPDPHAGHSTPSQAQP